MLLTSAPVAARATEERFMELLNELFRARFNGQPHASLLGDVTFPLCDVFFNQAEIAAPDANPQLHTVFVRFASREVWWAGGRCARWLATLCRPLEGVRYGATDDGRVEEAVNGRSVRTMPGLRIRWEAMQDGLHEQVLGGDGLWHEERVFPAADAIRWRHAALNEYVEQVHAAGGDAAAWTAVRTVQPTTGAWRGPAKRVFGDVLATIFARVKKFGGGDNRGDFLCRQVADGLKETFQDAGVRQALAAKGVHHVRLQSDPVPSVFMGYQSRMATLACQLQYDLPRLP